MTLVPQCPRNVFLISSSLEKEEARAASAVKRVDSRPRVKGKGKGRHRNTKATKLFVAVVPKTHTLHDISEARLSRVHVCVHVCACVCMCVHVCACVCMCVHVCAKVSAHTC